MLFLRIVKGNLEMWQWILLACVLLPQTIKDFKSKTVNVCICLITILAALTIRLSVLEEDNIVILLDLVPGFIMFVLSVLTKEEIGKGDALMLLFIGSVMGLNLEMEALCISFVLSGIVALVLFTVKKTGRKKEIPFVPFLSLGVLAGGII